MDVFGRPLHCYSLDPSVLLKRLSKIAEDLAPLNDADLDAKLLALTAQEKQNTAIKVAFALLSSLKVMPPFDQMTAVDRNRQRDGGP